MNCKRVLVTLSCALGIMAAPMIARASTISGTEYCGFSANVPTYNGLSSALASAGATQCATFTASQISFQVGAAGTTPATGPGSYTLGGFLTSMGAASGISYQNGYTANSTDNNTLILFTGSAYFVNGQSYSVGHDDGTRIYIGGTDAAHLFLSQPGPTSFSLQNYTFNMPTGTYNYDFLYGEVAGAPAVFITSLAQNATTPEPGSIVLLGTGLLSAAGILRRRLHA